MQKLTKPFIALLLASALGGGPCLQAMLPAPQAPGPIRSRRAEPRIHLLIYRSHHPGAVYLVGEGFGQGHDFLAIQINGQWLEGETYQRLHPGLAVLWGLDARLMGSAEEPHTCRVLAHGHLSPAANLACERFDDDHGTLASAAGNPLGGALNGMLRQAFSLVNSPAAQVPQAQEGSLAHAGPGLLASQPLAAAAAASAALLPPFLLSASATSSPNGAPRAFPASALHDSLILAGKWDAKAPSGGPLGWPEDSEVTGAAHASLADADPEEQEPGEEEEEGYEDDQEGEDEEAEEEAQDSLQAAEPRGLVPSRPAVQLISGAQDLASSAMAGLRTPAKKQRLLAPELAGHASASPGAPAMAAANMAAARAGALDEDGAAEASASSREGKVKASAVAAGGWEAELLACPKVLRHQLPWPVITVLQDWFKAHLQKPYPTQAERLDLCQQTNITAKQCLNWFTNARKRNWLQHPSKPWRNAWSDAWVPAARAQRKATPQVRASAARAAQPTQGQPPRVDPTFNWKAGEVLLAWTREHLTHPYPKPEEVAELAEAAHVTPAQVKSWFVNFRGRTWQKELQAAGMTIYKRGGTFYIVEDDTATPAPSQPPADQEA